jgi:hypothetical protein
MTTDIKCNGIEVSPKDHNMNALTPPMFRRLRQLGTPCAENAVSYAEIEAETALFRTP